MNYKLLKYFTALPFVFAIVIISNLTKANAEMYVSNHFGQSNNYTVIILQPHYATLFYNESSGSTDSTSQMRKDNNKSDLFYYILGIIILLAAGVIFKQRYEQYLKDKEKFRS